MAENTLPPIAVSFNQASEMTTLSRMTIRRAINRGEITTTKVGGRHLISYASLCAYVGTPAPELPANKLAYSIEEAMAATTLSRPTLWRLAREGKLETRKIRGRILVSAQGLRRLMEGNVS
jgi:excisionase family DNA binding protein